MSILTSDFAVLYNRHCGGMTMRKNISSILFVCHGNICRSPMAEFVMKDLLKKESVDIKIESAATSTEAIGCRVHRGTREKLAEYGISTEGKFAVQMTKDDYNKYDLIVVMDELNLKNIFRIIESDPENKVRKLLSFAGLDKDVADPWYTDNFDETYEDILTGCRAILENLKL